jgi:hypothetical protein
MAQKAGTAPLCEESSGMSHFTRVKTRMARREHLVAALTDLGYEAEEGDVVVRGWGVSRVRAQLKITPGRSGYDIGFQHTEEGYQIVADWYGIKGVKQRVFVEQLTQRYAYHAARAQLAEQGFALVSEEKQPGGRIHLVLRRMA